jgi:hypothetical protein
MLSRSEEVEGGGVDIVEGRGGGKLWVRRGVWSVQSTARMIRSSSVREERGKRKRWTRRGGERR